MSIKAMLMSNIENIKTRYLNGETILSISDSYGVNSGNLYPILKELGLLRRESVNYGKSEEFLPKIKELLDLGYSSYKISKEIGLSKPVVLKTMKKHGLSTSHKSKQREIPLYTNKDEIIRLYNEDKLSANQIAIRYSAAVGNVLKILNEEGIDTQKVLYVVDEHYWDEIDTPDKAWFLGLMYTDGNVRPDNTIRLCMTDLDIIEKCKANIGYEGPLYTKHPKQLHHKIQYELSIHRKGLTKRFSELGCETNKTYALKYPEENILPRELAFHFIRGALDGDGSITKTMLNFTGCIKFLKGIDDLVYDCLGIRFNWYHRFPEKGEDYPIRMIGLTKKAHIKDCLNLIYKYSTTNTRGDRKYDKAVKYYDLGNRNDGTSKNHDK